MEKAKKRRKNRNKLPVIDPTENVMSLVAAEARRQDDLRYSENRRIDDLRNSQKEFEHEIRVVRADYERRLALAESIRVDALATAESRRIDAVLAGMKADVTLANEKAGATASALAASVATSAAATDAKINELRNSHDKRLAAVEQNQYQQGGAKTQQVEGKMGNRWAIGVAVTIGLFVLAFMLARMWPAH